MRSFAPSGDEDSQDSSNMHYTITEEDLLMSSESEPGPYQLPPNIAARFYKSKDRRKSSAASSRRNSINSSRSARSSHGKPQSTHIAQHLRRASILESRKAKAANRNAHAEEVRSRAAMLRAAPRAAANREERAVAAQQARERYLAQVKANCAEEVKRSKRVAEEQREKRAAEHLKLKEDLEERHAEAERRKAMLQRRPRTATLPTSDRKPSGYVWKPSSPEQAARIIQGAWRNRQRACVVREFLDLGLTILAIQNATFEEVGELLNQERVLSSTSRVLKLLRLNDGNDTSVVRTFLSIFLVLGHPTHVLSNDGEQEKDLVTKASELLMHFNSVIDSSDRSASGALLDAYASYRTVFSTWRSDDSSYLISNMVAQFTELDAIWQTVKDDKEGAVAEDYKEGIQHNQTLVLAKIKRLAGPEKAMKLIKDAIRASRKSRAKKKRETKLDNKPRVASLTSLPAVEATSSTSDCPPTSQDPIASTRNKIESSSLVPPNRIVIHELAINKEWKINAEPSESRRHETISAIAKDLGGIFEAGLGDIWIPAMTDTIQKKLLDLLTAGNSLHKIIGEALDPELVAQQIKQGTFSYDGFFSFMNKILPQLCAPVRDAEVKALELNPSKDPVQQLARVYYIIDIIRLDMLNFTMQQLTPTLLEESAGYESRCFARELDGNFPDSTLQWWKSALAKASEDVPALATNQISANRIYMCGLIDLTIGIIPLEPADLPETLLLDHERLNRIRLHILRMITISSILLTAKNLLRRDVRSLWKSEAQRMWDLPFTSSPATFVSIVESRYALPPTTKQQLTSTITRLLADAREGQVTHPVMKVLLKKVKAHVSTRLRAASAEERIRASSTATEVLGTSGLPEFVARIGDIVAELEQVAHVDRESHGEWYDKVAARAAAEARFEDSVQ